MTLREIIENIDKSDRNLDYVDASSFLNQIGISAYIEQEPVRLKCYYFFKWYCTDTYVGGRVYFLDDEPVATSWQKGRKCNEEIYWISKETFKEVCDYLLSLGEKEELPEVEIVNLDVEIANLNEVWSTGGPILKSTRAHYLRKLRHIMDTRILANGAQLM